MKITILKVGNYQNKTIDEVALIELEQSIHGKELLGDLLTDNTSIRLNPDKLSHSIKDVTFNKLTATLDCTIECLSTPYGKQLKIFLQKFKNKIRFNPIYTYDDSSDVIKNLKLHKVSALIVKDLK
jgi:hypothetical protein